VFPALIATRLVHFAAVMILFGSSLFTLYAQIGQEADVEPANGRPSRQLARLFQWCAIASLASALGWLVCVAGQMSGRAANAFDLETLRLVLLETRFGSIWQVHLALSVLAVAIASFGCCHFRQWSAVILALSTGLIIGVAWAGHAGMGTGPVGVLFAANHVLHLISGAAWLGGLVPLGFALRRNRRDPGASTAATVRYLERFSTVGIAAVCALILTGSINVQFLIGSVGAAVASDWGRVLLLKLTLVGILLGVATVNRLVLLPRLAAGSTADRRAILSALIRNVMLEQGLGLLVIVAASALGTLSPPLAVT
jgi:putative copper resistance protein D